MAKKLIEKRMTIENHMATILRVVLMTPMGDPMDAGCIWGMPTIFWGGSGIGKTQRISQAADAYNWTSKVVLGAQHPPEDFSGVAMPSKSGGIDIHCVLGAFNRLNKIGEGVLVLDELSNCTPATQGAMLTFLTDRNIGDVDLSPKVRLLAAANYPDIAAGGYGLEPPMANRLLHLDVGSASVDDWTEWYITSAYKQATTPLSDERLIKENWHTNLASVKGLICQFLRANRSHLYAQPAGNDPAGGREWPSGRTWEMAGRVMTACRCLDVSADIERILVGGCVGQGIAVEFSTFCREIDLPDPQDVLENGWEVDTKRLDRTHAVHSSIQAYMGEIINKCESGDQTEVNEAATQAWVRILELFEAKLSDIALKSCETMVNTYHLGASGTAPNVSKAASAVLLRFAKSLVGAFAQGAT